MQYGLRSLSNGRTVNFSYDTIRYDNRQEISAQTRGLKFSAQTTAAQGGVAVIERTPSLHAASSGGYQVHSIGKHTTRHRLLSTRQVIMPTHTVHTRTPFLTALCPGLPGWAGTRKVKPIWISLKHETVSGRGISWDVCKSASCSRQITTPAPHHSVFYRLSALWPTAAKHCRPLKYTHKKKLQTNIRNVTGIKTSLLNTFDSKQHFRFFYTMHAI